MSSLPVSRQNVVNDPAFSRLKDHIIGATGLAYYGDKDDDLAGHVERHMARRELRDCGSYLNLLTEGPEASAELDALIEDLTIGETFFFRHREMFDALRGTVLPDLFEKNRASRQLRIWSAGCAIGAEPYSLAILLRRELAAKIAGWEVTIVGTDINRGFLSRAREARFEDWAMRGLSEEVKRSCFSPVGKSWLLAPEFKEGVHFQYHNLVTHPFPSLVNNLFAFDLVLCRNVTIYFNHDIVRRLIGQFHQCLVEGGWLGVGHAEPNTEFFRAFRTVNALGAVLYQKSTEPSGTPWSASPSTMPLPSSVPASPGFNWLPPPTEDEPVAPPREAPPAVPSFPNGADGTDISVLRPLLDRGEWEQALRWCQDALAREKLNPLLYFYHAMVLEQLGRHAETEHSLRRVLYLDRQFVLAHYFLGMLLQRTGRIPQAIRSFANVVQFLSRIPADRVFEHADGITASELEKLARMQLEILEAR